MTQKPGFAVPEFKALKDLAGYRNAAWLLKRHAVSVLPSVASLKALRSFARTGQDVKPLIGFGDPIFNLDELKSSPTQRTASRNPRQDPRLHRLLARRGRRPDEAVAAL